MSTHSDSESPFSVVKFLCSLITVITSPGSPVAEFYAAVKQESNLCKDIVKDKEVMTLDCLFHYNRTFETIISHMIGMLNIEDVTIILSRHKSSWHWHWKTDDLFLLTTSQWLEIKIAIFYQTRREEMILSYKCKCLQTVLIACSFSTLAL